MHRQVRILMCVLKLRALLPFALGGSQSILCRSNQQEARPPEVKAAHQAAGGSRCEAVTASVGWASEQGRPRGSLGVSEPCPTW